LKFATIFRITVAGLFVILGSVKAITVHAQSFGPTPPGTHIVPGVSVSERYDTNIYLAPPSFLPPGTQTKDFATTFLGSLSVLRKDNNVDLSILGGVDGNVYARNPGLNYFTTRVDAYADLNGWADHLVKGAQLRIYDYFRYTPLGAGFLTGGKAGTEDPFLRGIQSFRANTYSNTINTTGYYPVFKELGVEGSYAFSLYRVGSILAATSSGATYFDTMVHDWSAGPRWTVTRNDTVSLFYEQSLIHQTLSGSGGTPFNTNTQTVAARYKRTTPNWVLTLVGGGTLVEPASLAFPSGKISLSTSPERSTVFLLDLSRQAAPSFFLTAGALISNVAQLQVTHRLERHLTLRGSVNYGFNESVPKSADTQFTNITVSAGLNYMVTKTLFIDLFYDHNDFKTESPTVNYVILRDVIGLSLTTQWR
jgi:hypothetical protein